MALLCFTAGEDTGEEVKKGDLGSFPRITLFSVLLPHAKNPKLIKNKQHNRIKNKTEGKTHHMHKK